MFEFDRLRVRTKARHLRVCALLLTVFTPCAVLADDAEQVDFNPGFMTDSQGRLMDVSAFKNGNPLTPGTYRTDIYLNGDWQGRGPLIITKERVGAPAYFCFKLDDLKRWGLNLESLPNQDKLASLLSDTDCVELSRLAPDIDVDVDMSELRADLTISQAYLKRVSRGYVDPKNWDSGVTAGFVNYNSNLYQSEAQGVASTQSYLGLNTGINLGDWRLRHNGSYSYNRSAHATSQSGYQSTSSYVQRDLTGLKSQLTLGQYYTPGEVFDSVPFKGVQVSSDDRMLPDSMRGFAPPVRGVADTNAKVTIRQGDNILYETTVAPGPFVIDDLYSTGYSGDLSVTITEADGRTRSFVVPFSSVAQLLRPGTSRFSVTAGKYRDEYLSQTPSFIQGTYQRGISDKWSAYTGSIIAERYLAVQAGVAWSTPWGAMALDVTESKANDLAHTHEDIDSTMRGRSYRLTYSKLLDATQTNFTVAAYRFSSEGYLNFSDYAQLQSRDSTPLYRQRSRVQFNVNQPLGDSRGSVYFTGSAQNYWNTEQRSNVTYQAGYSNGYSWGSFNLSASRTRDYQGAFETQYMVGLNIPFGRTRSNYVSTNVRYTDNGNSNTQVNLGGSAGKYNELNYNLYGSADKNSATSTTSAGSSVQYRTQAALLSAGANTGKDYKQANAGISGSLVAHAGGVTFSSEQGETMALVEAKGANGARVGNTSSAVVDNNGYALVPGLMPYRQNDISIDPKNTPDSVELETTSQLIAPRYGAIALVQYPTISGTPVLLHVTRDDGKSLPMGAQVEDTEGNYLTMVGQGGRLFMRTNQNRGELVIRWGSKKRQSCRAQYTLPVTADSLQSGYTLMDSTCAVR
ncbi:fimbria/pilus outer membrane usher protein [Pseudomonas mucidolens]|uniref:Outer membrane usher protein n=1 Tax=Pseudomonas mucidolens TaxID=46679 RepID=A0A1H2NAL5_9PSED|nr:fimbria/pilus outer membrane usher protein [Pseudomonas mucidolens]SDV01866.1 outer membrane usher protein [Pseudomonas mucidolens]SQH32416.1 outer membrane usher protein [Pseudomonas mucidolens]